MRISHNRYKDVTDRGFNIMSNVSFDQAGPPPPPQTKPRLTLWQFRSELLKGDSAKPEARTPSGVGGDTPSRSAPGSTGLAYLPRAEAPAVHEGSGPSGGQERMPPLSGGRGIGGGGGESRGASEKSLSRAKIRSGGFKMTRQQE
jgi:hypothetical protein